MVPRLFWICKNWWCFSLFLFCKFCWKNPFGVLVLINLPAIYSRDLKLMTFLASVKTQISRRASEGKFPHSFILFGKPWVVPCLRWATSFVFFNHYGAMQTFYKHQIHKQNNGYILVLLLCIKGISEKSVGESLFWTGSMTVTNGMFNF